MNKEVIRRTSAKFYVETIELDDASMQLLNNQDLIIVKAGSDILIPHHTNYEFVAGNTPYNFSSPLFIGYDNDANFAAIYPTNLNSQTDYYQILTMYAEPKTGDIVVKKLTSPISQGNGKLKIHLYYTLQ